MPWFRSICTRNDVTPVGWVERSDTHQCRRLWRWVSLHSAHPTKTRFRDLATPCARGLLDNFRPSCSKGAGKTGCLLHPRSRVPTHTAKGGTRAYRAAGAFRPSLRNGFTAYFVLSPENGSFASVACASYRTLSASTAAPEPHDFAVRFTHARLRALHVHRISPHVRDDRERPSMGETSGVMELIWPAVEAEYFSANGWTGFD